MMKKFLRWWLGLEDAPKTMRVEIVWKNEAIAWTAGDAAWFRSAVEHPSWKKLEGILEDNIAQSLVPKYEAEVRPEFLKGYVTGKTHLLQFIRLHRGGLSKKEFEELEEKSKSITTMQETE